MSEFRWSNFVRVGVVSITPVSFLASSIAIKEFLRLQQQQEEEIGLDETNSTTMDAHDDEYYGGVIVEIDATSRAIVDGCGCPMHDGYDTVVLATRIAGVLSILGSIYVACSLSCTRARRAKNLKSTFNRLLLSLCFFDIISSLAFFFANWPIPTTPPNDGMHDGKYLISDRAFQGRHPGASGSDAMCSAQGFFIHFGLLGSTFATGFIALQTLLMVRYNWTESQMRRAEKVFFSVVGIYPLATASIATAMGLMNPLPTAFCWIEVSPIECYFISFYPMLQEYCEEVNPLGSDYLLYKLLLGFAVIFFTLILIVYSMISLYLSVRTQERRAARWSSNAAQGRAQRQVFTKGMLYISAYLMVWIPSVLAVLLDSEMITHLGGLIINTVVSFCLPLQGLLNALIHSGALDVCCRSCTQYTSAFASSALNMSFRVKKKKNVDLESAELAAAADPFASSKSGAGAGRSGAGRSGAGRSVGGGRPASSAAANAVLQDRTSSSVRGSQVSITEKMTDNFEKD